MQQIGTNRKRYDQASVRYWKAQVQSRAYDFTAVNFIKRSKEK